MPTSLPLARTALCIVAFVAFASTGCVDNSGGPPPAGEAIAFEIAMESPSLFCGSFEDSAHLIRTEADVDAYIDSCEMEMVGDEATIVEELDGRVAELEEGEALIVVSAVLGGCLGDWSIEAVHLDGEVLRPWMLKQNSAYGRADVACTADIGEGHKVLQVDAAAATSVELTVGEYNPDLPGAPVPMVDAQ